MCFFRGIAACLLASSFAIAGCAATGTQEDVAVQSIAPVNNAPEMISTCNRPAGSGVLVTFDDYGSSEQIQAILDKLRQHDMRAAFFPTGQWAEQNMDLIRLMQAEGHIVGYHSYTHAHLTELFALKEQSYFELETRPVPGVTNTDPALFRYPFGEGADNPDLNARLTAKNFQGCTWTADSRDWEGRDVEAMMHLIEDGDEMISKPLKQDGVVLAHMYGEHAPALIDALVTFLNQKGWAYERIS